MRENGNKIHGPILWRGEAIIYGRGRRKCRELQLHVPQILRGIFRRSRIDVEARATLETLDPGEPGHDLQVPVEVVVQRVPVAAALHPVRGAVEHEVVGRVVQRFAQALERSAKRPREVHDLFLGNVHVRAEVLLGIDPGLERIPGGKRRDDEEVARLLDHAFGARELLPDDIAEDAAFLVVVVGFCAVELFLHEFGDDRRGDDLGMRVVQGRAGGPALVLEDQDIAETAVAFEVENAVPVGPEDLFDLAFGQVFEPEGVLRALDDDLVSADAVHPVVDPAPLAIETALDMEDGEFAGDDAHPPAGRVG
jgi:hypothetical protein